MHLLLESILCATLAAILILLLRAGRSKAVSTLPGWRSILCGFALLLFGSAMDITDNFPELEHLVIFGPTRTQMVVEEVVGYLAGFILLGLGLAQWLPVIVKGREYENELFALKERHRMVSDLTTDLTCGVRVDDRGTPCIEWTTGSLHSSSGYSPDDIRTPEQWAEVVHPEDLGQFQEFLHGALGGERRNTELRVRTRDGRTLWVALSVFPEHDADTGRPTRLLGAVRDITARKLAEEQTRLSLEENRVLLQELNHRVKNNLQIITGLIEMAKSRIKDPEIRAICQEIHAKIGSISLVHTQLSREGGVGRIDFGTYARVLAAQVAEMYGRRDVEVGFDIDAVVLNLDRAVPCGLALNELLTNAFKHATGQGGRVDVGVRGEDGGLVITVADNGPGMPAQQDFAGGNHLGLKLLGNIVTLQLRGTIEFSQGPGTVATLRVPPA